MLHYQDIAEKYDAYIFELDDVLFPAKEYDLQVYYLFAQFVEYTEGFPPASDLVDFFKKGYESGQNMTRVYADAEKTFAIDEKYRENLERLFVQAALPLKIILYKEMLELMQQIVVDRKKLFIVTNGLPRMQLNKIRQTEWNGLEQYLRVYFAEELKPKPDSSVIDHICEEHHLKRRRILIIGRTGIDSDFADEAGLDFVDVNDLKVS